MSASPHVSPASFSDSSARQPKSGHRGIAKLRSGRARASLIVLSVMALGAAYTLFDWYSAYPPEAVAGFVGRQRCADCHQQQTHEWQGSHHDLAMDTATEETVLGDFNDATLEHHGVVSRMFRRDGLFYVNTEGPDGSLQDFQVKYVFGVEPLQQYMVEFDREPDQPPHELARIQVLRVSWDTARKRWFYLAPPDVKDKLAPNDPLHWTGSAQNWNHMCASCHSTGLQKNFDVASRRYHTEFSEIDVSCEACHGPGSLHVQLASSRSMFWDRNIGYGLRDLRSDDANVEIESCAPCHSRRRTVHPELPPGQDYYDCFSNELLSPTTYYCDGQILDEVYVYGSFKQSKMYHNGVRCSDCHDPHTTKLKLPGNKLCVSCHDAHPAGRYDTPAHHHHAEGSAGAQCTACHMPQAPFMDVDFRADHSLRVPRPDLSVQLNTPNACTQCHYDPKRVGGQDDAEQDAREPLPHYAARLAAARDGDEAVAAELDRVNRWAAEQVRKWYPNSKHREDHFASVLAAAWQQDPSSAEGLYDIARLRRWPAIVRASALGQLVQVDQARGWKLAERLLDDSDEQVRTMAVTCTEGMPAPQRAKLLASVLQDPVRSVRVEAARVLADVPDTTLRPEFRPLRTQALDEYRKGLSEHGDLAMSHMGLALLAERQGDSRTAIKSYRDAMAVQPDVTGPRTNLAALLERLCQQIQRDSQQFRTSMAEVQRLRAEELELLRRDATLAPESAAIQYRFGLACYLAGELDTAVESMATACQLQPQSEEFRLGLTLLLERRGERSAAVESVKLLLQLAPANAGYRQLQARIQAMAASASQ